MEADGVLSILAVLRSAGTDIWVGGGWGIDALVGRQTRQHRDLDLMHRKSQEPADHDRHAMAQLRQAFGIAIHF